MPAAVASHAAIGRPASPNGSVSIDTAPPVRRRVAAAAPIAAHRFGGVLAPGSRARRPDASAALAVESSQRSRVRRRPSAASACRSAASTCASRPGDRAFGTAGNAAARLGGCDGSVLPRAAITAFMFGSVGAFSSPAVGFADHRARRDDRRRGSCASRSPRRAPRAGPRRARHRPRRPRGNRRSAARARGRRCCAIASPSLSGSGASASSASG